MAEPSRRDEIATGLATVHKQLAAAASGAGRSVDEVTLVVVTKTWPVSDIRTLYDLGVRHIGENRHQEAEEKAAELSDLDIVWHFVGQIQSNKATKIAEYADVVHSVDSVRVAQRLNAGAHRSERVVDCMIQVSLDPREEQEGRGGLHAGDIDEVAHAVETAGGLRLCGVMGVAPLDQDPAPAYERLAEIRGRLVTLHPGADAMSAGMSGDFREAIAAGATHVRIGSAVLGPRPPLG